MCYSNEAPATQLSTASKKITSDQFIEMSQTIYFIEQSLKTSNLLIMDVLPAADDECNTRNIYTSDLRKGLPWL